MSVFEAHWRNPVTLWKGQEIFSCLLAPRSLTLPGFCIADSQLAECRGPPEVEGAPLFSLTEESFKACHLTLTLDDYLFIAFVGFVVSIASVATNFLLGITANCCHRWSKASEEEEIWHQCLSSLHAAAAAADRCTPWITVPWLLPSQLKQRWETNLVWASVHREPGTVLAPGNERQIQPSPCPWGTHF